MSAVETNGWHAVEAAVLQELRLLREGQDGIRDDVTTLREDVAVLKAHREHEAETEKRRQGRTNLRLNATKLAFAALSAALTALGLVLTH